MSYPFDLQIAWFFLVGLLLIGYAVLDGFDLGVGTLHLLAKGDQERRTLLNAIGPVWDGNEVWLVVGGGALFAAFPSVYATVFSALYLPFILLLMAIIFRAVAIEFRSKEESPRWRACWDVSFSVASLVIALLAGVALGNMIVGIPIGEEGVYQGGFFNLLNWYSVLVGLTTVLLFAMHGAVYAAMKTEGELQERARRWAKWTTGAFIALYFATTAATFAVVPHMTEKFQQHPTLWAVPAANLLAILFVPYAMSRKRELHAFLASSVTIACLMTLFGIGSFPVLVRSTVGAEYNLTLQNASATLASQTIMFSIALIGMPFVLAYTVGIYWVFRGKVKTEALHY